HEAQEVQRLCFVIGVAPDKRSEEVRVDDFVAECETVVLLGTPREVDGRVYQHICDVPQVKPYPAADEGLELHHDKLNARRPRALFVVVRLISHTLARIQKVPNDLELGFVWQDAAEW